MIVTEEQAKTKWCPMRRGSPASPAGVGNDPWISEGFHICIGSRCMMWRWEDETAAWKRTESGRFGCCGLANHQ